MHEMAIGETILKVIADQAKAQGIAHVAKAHLRVGRMQAFERSNLELCLKTYQGGAMQGVAFEIEAVPVALTCSACNATFTDERFNDFDFAHHVAHAPGLYEPPACPTCGAKQVTITQGQELELVSIEGS